jgi:hypothetical protein
MPSFKMRQEDGSLGASADYHTMIFTVGSTHHRLGLHLDGHGWWQLSHPATGIKVTDVYNTYHGVGCSSKDFDVKMAKELAKASFEAMIARHSGERFNIAIAKALLTFGDQLKEQAEAEKNRQSLLRGMSRTARKSAY